MTKQELKEAIVEAFDALIKSAVKGLESFGVEFRREFTGGAEPAPEPIPEPDPTPDPDPVVDPAPEVPPAAADVRYFMRGQRVLLREDNPAVPALIAAGDRFRVRKVAVDEVETLIPSFAGISAGHWPEIVRPDPNGDFIEFEAVETVTKEEVKTSAGTVRFLPFSVRECLPPWFRFYIEIQPHQPLAAHGLPASSNVSVQGPLVMRYVRELRKFLIEPFKQWLTPEVPAYIDIWSQYGCSWRQMVLDGAIYDPILTRPSRETSDAALGRIREMFAANVVPPRSLLFAHDEGQGTEDAEALAAATRYATLTGKPENVALTREPVPAGIENVARVFLPVAEWIGKTWPASYVSGVYCSCMANGACSQTNPTGPVTNIPTGTPNMVVEADPVNRRVYPWLVDKYGGTGLYYCATQALTTAREPGGLYRFRGNGDGTLFFPGDDLTPWPSIRLWELYAGIVDMAYLYRAGLQDYIGDMVAGPKSWETDWSRYETIRSQAAAAIWAKV